MFSFVSTPNRSEFFLFIFQRALGTFSCYLCCCCCCCTYPSRILIGKYPLRTATWGRPLRGHSSAVLIDREREGDRERVRARKCSLIAAIRRNVKRVSCHFLGPENACVESVWAAWGGAGCQSQLESG